MYIRYHKPKNELWNLWISSNAALATLPHLDIYSHDIKGKAMISSQEHLSFSYGGYSQAQAPISHVTCYMYHHISQIIFAAQQPARGHRRGIDNRVLIVHILIRKHPPNTHSSTRACSLSILGHVVLQFNLRRTV